MDSIFYDVVQLSYTLSSLNLLFTSLKTFDLFFLEYTVTRNNR